jgi:predicted phage terminase large subunit-like protein
MDAHRLSRATLDDFRETLGEYGYACQFLQTPIPRHGGMFKTERLKLDTPNVRFLQLVRYWDKAGTKDAGCYTAGVLMGRDGWGKFWVLDVVRGRWDSAEREAVIKATSEQDRAAYAGMSYMVGIEQEPGSGGKESAESTIRNLAGFVVRANRPSGDKAMRADPFSSQVNGGNVMLKTGEWNKAYIDELRYFPASRYKDQVDASSGAFSLLNQRQVVIGAI